MFRNGWQAKTRFTRLIAFRLAFREPKSLAGEPLGLGIVVEADARADELFGSPDSVCHAAVTVCEIVRNEGAEAQSADGRLPCQPCMDLSR
jgi:hypothetical protein